MDQMGDRIALLAGGLLTLNIAAPGAGAIITMFIAGLAIGAAVIVWISLLIRKALLLIAIVFAPIALAGSSWDHTRGWVGKWASFVIALILSKVVLVVIFLLATAQVSAPIDGDLQSVSDPIAGVVLMLIAGFAPYLTYKAISFMGFDMYHAMSAEQEAKSALNRPLPIPMSRRPAAEPSKVLDGASNGTGPSSGSAPAPAPAPSGSANGGAGGASGGATSGGARGRSSRSGWRRRRGRDRGEGDRQGRCRSWALGGSSSLGADRRREPGAAVRRATGAAARWRRRPQPVASQEGLTDEHQHHDA